MEEAVNVTARTLATLYLLGGGLAMHASITSAQHDATAYALGFAATNALLLVAAVREYLHADERRAAAIRAERVARLRAAAEEDARQLSLADLNKACCERWWTAKGTDHDPECPEQTRRAA